MLRLVEHVGFEKAHDPHSWWIYDAQVSSTRTCPLCIALDGTHYRGDELPDAFPYHIHVRVNMIKPMTHPRCRCRLELSGRTKDVLQTPLGLGKRAKPTIPRKYEAGRRLKKEPLSPSQRLQWRKVTQHARETYKSR